MDLTPGSVEYLVTPTANSCPGTATSIVVTINPLTGPTTFTGGVAEVCQDAPNETYTATAAGSTSIAYSVLPVPAGAIDPVTGVMNWDAAFYGNATITATSTGICNTTSANMIVRVKRLPAITSSPAPVITCEYGIVSFSVAATGDDLTYQWYEGSTPLSDVGVYFGSSTNKLTLYGATRDMSGFIYHATVTGCTQTVTSGNASLIVNTAPEIVSQPRDTTICSTQNAAFGVFASGDGLTYNWQVKIGAAPFTSVVNGVVFSGQGTDTLRLTGVPGTGFNNNIFRVKITGMCGSASGYYSNYVVLRVNVPPTVTKQPLPQTVCDGGGPKYFLSYGTGMVDSLRWQVSTDNGVNWNDIYENSVYSGTTTQQLALIDVPFSYNNYQYRLALKAFCATTYSNGALLTVNSLPVVTFAADPIPACGGVAQTLTPIISGGSGTWSQHTWTGDVGPLNNYFIQNPVFKTLIGDDPYNLNYRVKDSNGCYGEKDVTVIVNAPDATFTQDEVTGCTPATVNFTKDMTGITSWSWDFGDGTPVNTTDANPVHIFTNTTASSILYRTVRLTVTTGACSDTKSSLMTVYPSVDATFTASDDSICSGSQLTFTALPGANNYTWDYGDGVSGPGAASVKHLYITGNVPVTRTVQLITSSIYGCNDTAEINIVVMPMPQAQFSPAPPTQIYLAAGNPVTFTDLTTPAGASWTYSWDFGDGGSSTAQNPVHTYTLLGTYDVVLTVSNEKCSSQVTHQVTILPEPPIARFDFVQSGCAPLNIVINNTTVNKDTPGTTFFWDFGDGSTSTVENPTYTYFTAGTFLIKLYVDGPGGKDDTTQVIHAYVSPQAYFEVAPDLVYVNDEKVRTFNGTQYADYYLWDFGDGDTSKVKEPFHKYMEEGVYDITLWAYSSNGCSDKYVLSPAVTVEPPGEIRFATVFTPNTGGEENVDVDNINSENMDRFFYPPIKEKVMNYKLQIFNRQGMLIFESNSINKPWNGYYKGKLCPQGVYVWYVEGKYANGKPFKQVGDITLLH
jgi:PKD repeat protein